MIDITKLNKEQQEAVNTTNGPVLIIAGAGTGKSLLNGTKVLTEKGYINIEELKINDKVFGSDGFVHTVLGVFPQGKKEIIEIMFSDNTIIKCCEDHLWTFYDQNDFNNQYTKSTKEIEKLNFLDFYIPICNPINFKSKQCEKEPYKAGRTIGYQDKNTKDLNMVIPNIYKYNDVNTRIDFLMGLLDENAIKNNNLHIYSTKSKQMALDIQFLCETLGFIMPIEYLNDQYVLKINISDNKSQKRYIKSIIHTGKFDDMTCIQIDSNDSLFVTEHCILTHNTTVLTYRLANLIDKGVNPENILLLTFTNKAADEMTIRAKNLLEIECDEITGSTYHSFCAELLRHYASFIGFNSNFTVCDESDAAEILNLIKERNGYTKEMSLPTGKQLIAIYSYMINKDKDLDYTLTNKYPDYLDCKEELAKIKEDYIEYKFDKNLLDYDDLLLQTIFLFEEFPEICKRISDKYQYIMVDEYQDSNLLQMKLLKLLRQFENKNICVVGDPEQCLLPETVIQTKSGPKLIKDLVNDDEVLVYAGNDNVVYSKIQSINKKEIDEEIYEITTSSGKKLKGTKNHIIFAASDMISKVKLEQNAIYINYKLLWTGKFNNKLTITTYTKENEMLIKKYTSSNEIYGDNDELIDLIDTMISENPEVNFHVSKTVKFNGKYLQYTRLSELRNNSLVAIYDNGKVLLEKVVDIKTFDYNGLVYDINIPDYRNYIANNIFVHNCIYGFRGSNHDNILNFPDMFEDCKVIKLNQNYRSNQEILDLSNSILTTKGSLKNDLKATYNIGYKPKLVSVNTQADEAQYVLNQILKYKREGVPLSEMAVLMRSSNSSNMLEALIAEQYGSNSIDYQKFGGIKFLEREFVKNIFSYLKIMINNKDEISWFRILKLYPAIGSVNAKKITENITKNGMEELLDKSYEKKKFGEYLPEIYNFIQDLDKLDFTEQMEKLINEYYYKVKKRSIQNMKIKSTNKIKKLKELDKEIEEAQVLIKISEEYKSASKFVNDLTLDVQGDKKTGEFLTISTVHSAKGLEFKVVFILDCIQGSFPWNKHLSASTKEAMDEYLEEMEEEKRVFYVAITRAKEDLYLMCPQYNLFSRDCVDISEFLTNDNIYKNKCEMISKSRDYFY